MNACPIPRSSKGFTIVELVVTLVVSTIVVGFVMLFMTTPVDAYFAQARRAELIVEAELIKRNLDSDIRYAVPNSIRKTPPGPIVILEMLFSTDTGVYPVKASVGAAVDELDTTVADGNFSTFGRLNRLACPPGSRLIVGQDQSSVNTNAYAGAQVITPVATAISCPNAAGKANITILPLPGFKFFTSPPTHKVFVVSGTIAYVCDSNAHTLTRYYNYPIALGIAANRNAAATTGVISKDINSCNFNIVGSTATHGELVSTNIQLLRAPTTETLTTMIQSAVENAP
jgi:MSHA biogenesis protein MshO